MYLERHAERRVFDLLLPYPNAQTTSKSGQHLHQKLGVHTLSSTWAQGVHRLEPPTVAFTGTVAKNWMGTPTAGTPASATPWDAEIPHLCLPLSKIPPLNQRRDRQANFCKHGNMAPCAWVLAQTQRFLSNSRSCAVSDIHLHGCPSFIPVASAPFHL